MDEAVGSLCRKIRTIVKVPGSLGIEDKRSDRLITEVEEPVRATEPRLSRNKDKQ